MSATGVYADIEDLIRLRFQLKNRRLSRHQKLISEKGGYHQAIRKGRGMDFSEVREYTLGDDIRHIDWKVSARTQKTHTKVFTEELEKPIVCLLEQTPALFFGSHTRFKTVQGLNIMSILGWISLHQGDRFGGMAFNHNQYHWIEPRHQHRHLMQLLQQALALQTQLKTPGAPQPQLWPQYIMRLQKQLRPGSRIFLIGDFLNLSDPLMAQLSKLKRHSDVVLIHLYDPLEQHLPDRGMLKLTNGEAEVSLNTSNHQWSTQYSQQYQSAWQATQQKLMAYHIPLISIATDQNPLDALIQQGVIQS